MAMKMTNGKCTFCSSRDPGCEPGFATHANRFAREELMCPECGDHFAVDLVPVLCECGKAKDPLATLCSVCKHHH